MCSTGDFYFFIKLTAALKIKSHSQKNYYNNTSISKCPTITTSPIIKILIKNFF